MKAAIHTKNCGALGTRTIPLSPRVTLVTGPNAAGKSTLIEGIEWVLYGRPMRGCRLKADCAQVITDGAKDGSVELVDSDGGKTSRSLRTGNEIAGRQDGAPWYAVMHGGLTALAPDKRRSALMEHFGIEVSGKALADRLAASCPDAPANLIEHVAAALRGGLQAGESFAKERASEARGAWQVLTGERYGSQKAEGWAAVPPQWDGAPLSEGLVQQLGLAASEADTLLASAQQALGFAQALPPKPTESPSAAKIARAQTTVDECRENIASIEEELADLRSKSDVAFTHHCPACDALLRIDIDAMQVEQVDEPLDVEDLQQRISERNSALRQARADLYDAQRILNQMEQAADTERQWRDDDLIEQCRADVEAAQRRRAEAATAHQQARTALSETAAAERTTAEAQKQHEDVKAWVAIAERLGPDGIAREIADEAIDRLADAFRALPEPPPCLPGVSMTTAGEILVNDRTYERCSESERWRADLVLLMALAPSGALVCVDRFDVLEPALRPEVLHWVVDASAAASVQALIAGTLKADPGEDVMGAAGVWLGTEHEED